MSIKTIFSMVLAVAVGGAAVGYASRYRSDCCSNEAKKEVNASAAISKESLVSDLGDCHGGCAHGDASADTKCCQTSGLLKSVIAQSGEQNEGECHGDCASGDSAGGGKCCQDAEKSLGIVASPK